MTPAHDEPRAPHPAALPDDALLAQCELSKNRTRGPGGQHRNKVESGVFLTHTPTGLHAQATERRSSADNKRVALQRLRLELATKHREPVPIPRGLEEPASALWRSRRRGEQLSVSPDHHDYPTLLAEALDMLADSKWDPRKAALRLGVSSSQLIKLIKDHPPALHWLNDHRRAHHLHALH